MNKHGYYIALQNKMFGDIAFAKEAKEIFDSFGFTFDKKKGYQGGKFDGVSIWETSDGRIIKRVSLHDYFSQEPKVLVKDFPFQETNNG